MARRGLASARPAGEKASADILACAVNYVITRIQRRISGEVVASLPVCAAAL